LDKNIEKKIQLQKKTNKKGNEEKESYPLKQCHPMPHHQPTHIQNKSKQNKTKQIKTNSPASIPLSSSHTHGYF
jgi:hypothetical protein